MNRTLKLVATGSNAASGAFSYVLPRRTQQLDSEPLGSFILEDFVSLFPFHSNVTLAVLLSVIDKDAVNEYIQINRQSTKRIVNVGVVLLLRGDFHFTDVQMTVHRNKIIFLIVS